MSKHNKPNIDKSGELSLTPYKKGSDSANYNFVNDFLENTNESKDKLWPEVKIFRFGDFDSYTSEAAKNYLKILAPIKTEEFYFNGEYSGKYTSSKYQLKLQDSFFDYLPRISNYLLIENTIISDNDFETLIKKSSHIMKLSIGENKILGDMSFNFKLPNGIYYTNTLCLGGLSKYNESKQLHHFNN